MGRGREFRKPRRGQILSASLSLGEANLIPTLPNVSESRGFSCSRDHLNRIDRFGAFGVLFFLLGAMLKDASYDAIVSPATGAQLTRTSNVGRVCSGKELHCAHNGKQ